MRIHEGYEVTGEWSKKLALLTHLVNILEGIRSDFECMDSYICEPLNLDEVLGSSIRICTYKCNLELRNEDLRAYFDELVRYELINDFRVKHLTYKPSINEVITRNDIYSKLSSLFDELFSYLGSYVLRTSIEGIEYMVIVLRNGKAALLEGERNSISIPNVGVIASAHTHIKGCLPSPHDVRSLMHMLFDGGIGLGIMSRECLLKIIRVGPFTEDDYYELALFRNYLRRHDVDSLRSYLGKGFIGRNIRLFIKIT